MAFRGMNSLWHARGEVQFLCYDDQHGPAAVPPVDTTHVEDDVFTPWTSNQLCHLVRALD